MFLKLNAKRRAIYILSLAVENVSEQFFDNFLLYMQNEYNRMNTIHSIIWHNRIENEVKEAFHYMLTSKNIFRFLWDMTNESLSGIYGYRLNRNNFEVFCTFDEIEKYVADRRPVTADEKIVVEIYEAYKNGTNDLEREVYRGEELKVKL